VSKYNAPEDNELVKIIQDLQDRIDRLEKAPRAIATSLDSGSWQVKDPETGNIVGYIGAQPNGDTGVSFYRNTGTIAIRVAKVFPNSSTQTMVLYNKNGDVIGGDQTLINGGMASYMPISIRPINSNVMTTTSTSWADLFDFSSVWVSSALQFHFDAMCSVGTMTAEVRAVYENGTPMAGYFGSFVAPAVVPLNTTTWTLFDSYNSANNTWIIHNDFFTGAPFNGKIQARITAGTGTLSIRMRQFMQRPF
jgi:hypothetical protein